MFREEEPLESAPFPSAFHPTKSESSCAAKLAGKGRRKARPQHLPDDSGDGASLGTDCLFKHQLRKSLPPLPELLNIYSFIQTIFLEYLLYKHCARLEIKDYSKA